MSSLLISDNVAPYISGEKGKMRWDVRCSIFCQWVSHLIPGERKLSFDRHAYTPLRVYAAARVHSRWQNRSVTFGKRQEKLNRGWHETGNRGIGVRFWMEGYTETVSVHLSRRPTPSPQEVRKALHPRSPVRRLPICPAPGPRRVRSPRSHA